MTLKTVELVTAPNPTVAVIWMHGLGSDGNDFVPIVKELNLEGCPAIRFVFPHAPMLEVTINGGRMMPAWFDISSSEFGRDDDEASVRSSEVDIRALIEREKERGIATDKILIGGFSQGCAMTFQTGLRYPEKLGGLLCLSGYLTLEDSFEVERSEANKNIPIYTATVVAIKSFLLLAQSKRWPCCRNLITTLNGMSTICRIRFAWKRLSISATS